MGIRLERDLGTPRLTFSLLASIVRHLPDTSATARARRDYRPTTDTLLLRRIEFWTHLTWWSKTKAAEKGAERPILIPLRGDSDARKRGGLALDEKLARQNDRRAARQALLEGRPSPASTEEG